MNLCERSCVLQQHVTRNTPSKLTVKKTTLGLIFLLLAVVIIQGCSSSGKDPQLGMGRGFKKATSVEAITVARKSISEQIRAYGTVQAKDIVQVTPQVTNRVTHIYAHLGDTVRAGQKLAKIYSSTYQDQVVQAKSVVSQNMATFVQDSTQYARQKELYKRQLISASTLDQAKAAYLTSKSQLQSAKSSLSQSREDLNNSVIRSPVYGVVITRNIAVGDLATTGQAAFKIGNLTGYQMSIYLPRDEWKSVRLGQDAHFQLSGNEMASAEGRVTHISPQLDPTTGLGQVKITFTKKGPDISQGMLIKAIIDVETHSNAIVIPRSAMVENVKTIIQPESNTIQAVSNYSAFVIQGDTLALKHKLTLGIEQGNQVEVLKGLQAGDKIVTTGQANLADSSRVRVVNGNILQNGSIPLGQGNSAKQDTSGTKKQPTGLDSSSTKSDNE
jgi:RND family efflux transporter MFP subunit